MVSGRLETERSFSAPLLDDAMDSPENRHLLKSRQGWKKTVDFLLCINCSFVHFGG